MPGVHKSGVTVGFGNCPVGMFAGIYSRRVCLEKSTLIDSPCGNARIIRDILLVTCIFYCVIS